MKLKTERNTYQKHVSKNIIVTEIEPSTSFAKLKKLHPNIISNQQKITILEAILK